MTLQHAGPGLTFRRAGDDLQRAVGEEVFERRVASEPATETFSAGIGPISITERPWAVDDDFLRRFNKRTLKPGHDGHISVRVQLSMISVFNIENIPGVFEKRVLEAAAS